MIGTGNAHPRALRPRHRRAAIVFLTALSLAAAGDGPFENLTPVLPAPPALRADTAIYHMDRGVLQFAFTFANASDSSLFLDCQVPPKAALSGHTLILEFDRRTADSGAVSAYPPQRVGGNQTFQGQRRLDGLFGDSQSRPLFTRLQLRMAFYPEGALGQGKAFDTARGMQVESRPIPVLRKGRALPPPKARKYRIPGD